ncbi:uncharacterized protein LOC110703566 [Chenopodium quinoa]|uniref:uncharacterized protein LOC110703566 n=1 Tax=Chenopodium quinoa TaxID=63459 RepID=UPI000B76F30C|nr:uncharacterized protein LOC110703566 [Chenopodium quinoa]
MYGKIKETNWWDIWCLAWGIWLKRNAWVFDKREKREADILYKTMCLVGEFEEANANADMGMQVQYFSSRWKPPAAGLYKLNTDAAFQGQWLGIGGILRNEEGTAVVAFCSKENGKVDVAVGEVIGMRSSLKIAMEAGFRNFILETDNIKLFHHLKKGSISPCSFGNLVRDILMLARSCQSCVFSFVRRSGNMLPIA